MRLVAIRDEVEVFSLQNTVRIVRFGEELGILAENKNDGSLKLASGELVDVDSVAIKVEGFDNLEITPTTFAENTPKANAINEINPASTNLRIKKIIALSLMATGTYLIFNGRKAIGISMIVFGFITIKNTNN